jgi:hypothetical protein
MGFAPQHARNRVYSVSVNMLSISGIPFTTFRMEAGQMVLAGSFIRPIEARKGDTIQADYGPYGSVSCYFA